MDKEERSKDELLLDSAVNERSARLQARATHRESAEQRVEEDAVGQRIICPLT